MKTTILAKFWAKIEILNTCNFLLPKFATVRGILKFAASENHNLLSCLLLLADNAAARCLLLTAVPPPRHTTHKNLE